MMFSPYQLNDTLFARSSSLDCDTAVEEPPVARIRPDYRGSLFVTAGVTIGERSPSQNAVMHLVELIGVRLARLVSDEQGQAMVEYALILVLIAIVVIVVLIILGNQVQNVFCNISGAIGQ